MIIINLSLKQILDEENEEIFMKISFVVAHPDDEIISCGGTLLTANKKGDDIRVVLVTDSNEDEDFSRKRIEVFEQNMEECKCAYNILERSAYHINHSDNSLIFTIRKLIEDSDMVITHHINDFNVDHSEVSKATILACRNNNADILFMNSYAPEKIRDFRDNFYYSVSNDVLPDLQKFVNRYRNININRCSVDYTYEFITGRMCNKNPYSQYRESFEAYRIIR